MRFNCFVKFNKCGVGHCDETDIVKGGNRLQLTSKFTPNLDIHKNYN